MCTCQKSFVTSMANLNQMHACMLIHFSRVWLFATLWTVVYQAPLRMGFSRQGNECNFTNSFSYKNTVSVLRNTEPFALFCLPPLSGHTWKTVRSFEHHILGQTSLIWNTLQREWDLEPFYMSENWKNSKAWSGEQMAWRNSDSNTSFHLSEGQGR